MMWWSLLFVSLIWAEPRVVSGVLLEKGTRVPVSSVNLFLLPHKLKATTGEKGEFRFENVPPGEFQIVINQTGYYRFDQKYTDFPKDEFTLYLEKKRYDYFETTVVAKGQKRDQSRRSLGQEDFLTAPGAGKDPVKAVQNLPGVGRTAGGSAQIVIQGSDPNSTSYLIDGHEVPLIFHFGGLSSIITPEAVEGVDYLSAGYGPEYGRAIGGLVQLRTRAPKSDRWQGFSFFDNFNAGGLSEGPISENGQLLVSGRYAYIGTVLKSVFEDNEDFDLSVAPTYYDLTTIYEHSFGQKNRVRWTVLTSKDTLEFILSNPINNDPGLRGTFFQQTEFTRLITTWNHEIDDRAETELSIAVGENNIELDLSERFFNVKSTTLSTRGEYQREMSSWWTTYLGFDNNYTYFDLDLGLTRSFSEGGISNPQSSGEQIFLSDEGRSIQLGLYTRQEFRYGASLISPNLRLDSFRAIQRDVVQPRVNYTYQYSPSLELRAAYGMYFQEPEPAESGEGFGNPNLAPLKSEHTTIGFSKDFREGRAEGWQLRNNYFYKWLEDLVIPSDRVILEDGEFVTENYANEGVGTVVGTEVEATYTLQNAAFKLAYTYLQSRRRSPGTEFYPAEFDQTHSLNLLAKYEWDRWILSGRFRYVTGNPETPVVGAVLDADSGSYIPIRGDLYSSRSEDFVQLDLRADRKWVFNTWILSLYFDIQNALNNRNVESRRYSFDYSETEDIMGLPVLPSFGLKAEF